MVNDKKLCVDFSNFKDFPHHKSTASLVDAYLEELEKQKQQECKENNQK